MPLGKLQEDMHLRQSLSVSSMEYVMKMASRITALAMLATILGVAFTYAQSSSAISIDKPFSRATPGGAKVAAGYMTITNNGTAADRLVSASSPAAGKVEIHEMTMQGDVMKMHQLSGGLLVGAGKTISLAPGGYHLMLVELKAPLKKGDKVPVTLNFEKAGKIDVTLDVQAIGAPAAEHMHKM